MNPFQRGYRMPAEWARHEATGLGWPHEESEWRGKFEPIPWLYAEIVRHLSKVERVHIMVVGQGHERVVAKILEKCDVDLKMVRFFQYKTNRSWTRDYCPLFVQNAEGHVAATGWKFNGWAKDDNWQRDRPAPIYITEAAGM